MIERTMKEKLQVVGLKTVIPYVEKDPDQNIPKIADWLLKHDIGGDSLTLQTCKVPRMWMPSAQNAMRRRTNGSR